MVRNKVIRTQAEVDAERRLHESAIDLMKALQDAVESLKRLPNVDGAYRVTCIEQGEKAIAKAKGNDPGN